MLRRASDDATRPKDLAARRVFPADLNGDGPCQVCVGAVNEISDAMTKAATRVALFGVLVQEKAAKKGGNPVVLIGESSYFPVRN
jgi:hypothetical protein